MSTQHVETKYTVDASQAHAGIDALIAKLRTLGAEADAAGRKVKTVGSGASTSLNSAARSAEKLTGDLGALETRAQSAALGLQGVARHAKSLGSPLKKATGNAEALGVGLASIAGAAAGIHLVKQAAAALSEALQSARDYARETAEANIKLKDSVRELKALGGKGQTSTQASAEVVDLMLKTGATQDEATAFSTQFKSTVFAAQQSGNWKLDEAETEKAKVEALHFAVAKKIDPKALGVTIASIGVNEKIESRDQLMSKVAGMHQMEEEGVGEPTEIYKVATKLRGLMVRPDKVGPDGKPIKGTGMGAFQTEEELMAAVGVTTVDSGTPAAATQSMKQVWRELNSFGGDEKGKTLARLGITPADDYVTRIEKIAPLIEEANKPGGQGAQAALKDAGFGLSAANEKIIIAVRRKKLLRERQDRMQVAADPAALRGELEQFDRENPARKGEARLDAARFLKGREQERLMEARKSSLAALVERGETVEGGRTWGEMLTDWANFGGLGGADSAKNIKADNETFHRLVEADPSLVEKYPELKSYQSRDLVGAGTSTERLAEILNEIPEETFAKLGRGDGTIERRVEGVRKGEAVPPKQGPAAPPPQAALGGPADGLVLAAAVRGGGGALETGEFVRGRDDQGPGMVHADFQFGRDDVGGGLVPAARQKQGGRAAPRDAGGAKGAGDGGAAAPQASIDASDLKEAARALIGAAEALARSGGADDYEVAGLSLPPIGPGRA